MYTHILVNIVFLCILPFWTRNVSFWKTLSRFKIFRNSSLHLHFLVYSQAVYHRIIYFCKHFYTVRVIPPPVAVFDIVFVFSFRWTKKKRKWNLLLFSKLIKKNNYTLFSGTRKQEQEICVQEHWHNELFYHSYITFSYHQY